MPHIGTEVIEGSFQNGNTLKLIFERIFFLVLTLWSLLFSAKFLLAAFSSFSVLSISFSNDWMRLFSKFVSRRNSSFASAVAVAALPPVAVVPPGLIASISRLSRRFSSLYVCNWRFHSSTLAVDSCSALVNRILLLFSVANSISHFLALAQLQKMNKKTKFSKVKYMLRVGVNLDGTFGLEPFLVVHFHISVVVPCAVLIRWTNYLEIPPIAVVVAAAVCCLCCYHWYFDQLNCWHLNWACAMDCPD